MDFQRRALFFGARQTLFDQKIEFLDFSNWNAHGQRGD